ncbi:hypothetical protein COB21_05770 [Candidatus Aerophobetes bacterium]|uniref:Thymidylate synthase n=1 Tax=Aerophobetes bacterium TaxID=2030807 RepID=A0A2A4WY25_UNCAE|nr:MAG: hypothetical protein COB21_05770 [Candidatus Aerophobetes bacterium]
MFENYETFTREELKTLKKYVTSTTDSVFVLRNLPEVIKGALFSRYSRSSLGLRSLLLKDFINNNEQAAFSDISGNYELSGSSDSEQSDQNQIVAVKKAQNFYDRILDGYGDDSIGELGGAHLAVEHISMLAAKVIQDARIGGSPLEKSTRYIYFDQKHGGKYLFYRDPVLMTSAFRDLYIETCDNLFDTYRLLIPPLTDLIRSGFPQDPNVSSFAYNAALRAKVLDCLRGLLPASSLTNMGVFGNGRFFDSLIHKLHSHSLSELQEVGKSAHRELSKVIPSFVKRSSQETKYQADFAEFFSKTSEKLSQFSSQMNVLKTESKEMVSLIDYDKDGGAKVAASIMFAQGDNSLKDLENHMRSVPKEEVARLFSTLCETRGNRRHKSPRALERAEFTFEIVADFGIYRDLHRHRMLTQERQLLTCDLEYYVPKEIKGTAMEVPYREALESAQKAFDQMRHDLPEEAQYVVPMAYNIRWYFHVNLRSLQWMCELRSGAAGHPMYRLVAQEMAKQVIAVAPEFEPFFKFVDYEGYELGRLEQEIRSEKKQKSRMS